MINPRHWPDDLWETDVEVRGRPARRRRREVSSPDKLDDKTYTFEGNEIALEEALDRCRVSFVEMRETIEKLKKENDYVPDYKLMSVLPGHINDAAKTDQLCEIRAFLEQKDGWSDAVYWEMVGNRYLTLGDTANGWECLERTVRESPMSGALATLIEYDRGRAEAFIVQSLTERLKGPEYYGFDAPNVIANACDLLGDKCAVEAVFDDYLQHCQELFSQWPSDRSFDDLAGWGDSEQDEDEQITHLLIDRLYTHATESGDRLVCTICSLAERRGEKVFPILSQRVASADGLQLWRLLQVFSRLSHSTPRQFRDHCHGLLSLLDRGDSFLALVASRAILRAYTDEPIPYDLEQAIKGVSRRYSSTIFYRGFGFLKTTPSQEFIELTKRAAQFPFRRQLKALCEILSLDLESITAHLERRLLETGTTLEREKEIARSMGRAFVHPQGWPMLW